MATAATATLSPPLWDCHPSKLPFPQSGRPLLHLLLGWGALTLQLGCDLLIDTSRVQVRGAAWGGTLEPTPRAVGSRCLVLGPLTLLAGLFWQRPSAPAICRRTAMHTEPGLAYCRSALVPTWLPGHLGADAAPELPLSSRPGLHCPSLGHRVSPTNSLLWGCHLLVLGFSLPIYTKREGLFLPSSLSTVLYGMHAWGKGAETENPGLGASRASRDWVLAPLCCVSLCKWHNLFELWFPALPSG